MNTKAITVVLAAAALMLMVGCASGNDDGAAADGANALSAPATSTPTLKAQMAACQKLQDKVAKAGSQADMGVALLAVRDCYQKALASHAAEIDAIRKKNGGIHIAPTDATAAAYFDAYRANHAAKLSGAAPKRLCDIENAASLSFGGTAQDLEDKSCVAGIEIRIAKLVASEVTLPGGTTPLTSADGTIDELHALVPKVVAQILQNTPGDSAAATADVTATLDGAVAASNDLCGLLEGAGRGAGLTAVYPLAEGCSDKAIGLLVAEVKNTVNSR